MSCTEIFGFDKNGDAYYYDSVENAWRGGMAIWHYLEKKYLPPYYTKYAHFEISRCHSMDNEAMKDIWQLANDERVSEVDKICLITTFDNVLVKKEDMPKVIEAFRSFDGETSLKEQADILEAMANDDDCIAVGWNQTSVNADTWEHGSYNEETDEVIPYNCLTQDKHGWLFHDTFE